jgi:cobalt-zinc-cadmium efflux system outer membrane protein
MAESQSAPETVAGTQKNQRDSLQTDEAMQAVSFGTLPTPIASSFVDQQSGLSVEDLIRTATERSRELLAARQNIVIGQGRIVQAGLRPNPSINYDATNDRAFGAEGEGSFGISYLHPIELGGKRGKRLEVARLELERAQAELAFRERQLQADIKSQYAEALATIENLRAVEQLWNLNDNMLRLTQVRLSEGDVPKLDVNLVRVEVNRLQAQMRQLENRARAVLLGLRTLAGMDVDQVIKLRGELQAPPVELTLEAAQELAFQNRADLKAAKIAEEVAEAEIRLAKAEAVPDVTPFVGYRRERSIFGPDSLGGTFGSAGLTPGARLSDTDKFLSFGVSVQLPFFNRNQGAIQEAAGRLAQARHTREFVELVVKRDVAIAMSRYQSARESVELFQKEILPRGRENLQIIRAAYTLGDQPIFEVIAEQRRFIESQNQYVEALKEYYQSQVELERAIGRPLK